MHGENPKLIKFDV